MFSENFFYNNWIKTENKIKNNEDISITYNLALENIEDFQYINLIKENLELLDIKKLNSLKGSNNYVILLIYFTEDKLRAFIKTFIEKKEIDKSLDLKIYTNNEIKTYEEAIASLKEEVSQIWKSQNLIDVNTPSFLHLFLDTKKTNDYLKLKTIFDSIDIIENYSVLEMTNKQTKIRIKYRGKIIKLKNKLLEKKVKIEIKNNIWRTAIN